VLPVVVPFTSTVTPGLVEGSRYDARYRAGCSNSAGRREQHQQQQE
jgi:hypothetical protein